MRNSLVTITALCIGSALIGCAKNKPNQPILPSTPVPPRVETPAPHGSIPNSPNSAESPLEWTLKYQAKCPESVNATECVGLYGFTITNNGHYIVGPGPAGEQRVGTIKPEDLSKLGLLLSSTLSVTPDNPASLSLRANEEHLTLDAAGTSDDTVSLAKNTGEAQKLLRTSGLDFYYSLKSGDDAKALYSAIHSIAATYYAPLPFPDTCEDGLVNLQALSSSILSCSTDAECTYLDANLDAISPNQQTYLETENCSRISPISVGNSAASLANKDKILALRSQVEQACGDKLARADCTQQSGFNLPGNAPICQQGTCKIPSSVLAPTTSSVHF